MLNGAFFPYTFHLSNIRRDGSLASCCLGFCICFLSCKERIGVRHDVRHNGFRILVNLRAAGHTRVIYYEFWDLPLCDISDLDVAIFDFYITVLAYTCTDAARSWLELSRVSGDCRIWQFLIWFSRHGKLNECWVSKGTKLAVRALYTDHRSAIMRCGACQEFRTLWGIWEIWTA